MARRGLTRASAALAILLALGALGAGVYLHAPLSRGPRLTVLNGTARIRGGAVEPVSRLPVGLPLEVASHADAATVQYGTESRFTLSGRSRLSYRGRSDSRFEFRLIHGRMFVSSQAGDGHTSVLSPLGSLSCRGATCEVYATAMPVGSAIDTPRVLRLAVAEGCVLLRHGRSKKEVELVPAGVRAEIREGVPRILMTGGLEMADWQRLTGKEPAFADSKLLAREIPAGVWVRRNPGRNGPTPGSLSGATAFYSPKLPGGVLLAGGGAEQQAWTYDAEADRWSRIPGEERAGLTPVAGPAAPSPPGGGDAARVAYSPKAEAFLLYGRVGRGAETWIHPKGAGNWRRLLPPANPPPRDRHGLYYDPVADLFVLYGGDAHGRAYDDTWVFRLGAGK
jgi:hypothetical protein